MFEKIKERLAIKRKEKIIEQAKVLFQVTEHNNELWLMYNGIIICPMEMFKIDPIDALKIIRGWYITNNTNNTK